jgi:hypothetical protein
MRQLSQRGLVSKQLAIPSQSELAICGKATPPAAVNHSKIRTAQDRQVSLGLKPLHHTIVRRYDYNQLAV